MKEIHFKTWDYNAVKELEELSQKLPIIDRKQAKKFFARAKHVTKCSEKITERYAGKLFGNLQGFVGASDRKDFTASYDDFPGHITYGVLMVETFDRVIGITFCVARISEVSFYTCGWTGEKNRQLLKNLRNEEYRTQERFWWQLWK